MLKEVAIPRIPLVPPTRLLNALSAYGVIDGEQLGTLA